MSWKSICDESDRIIDADVRKAILASLAVPRRHKMKWRLVRALRALPGRSFSKFMFPIIQNMTHHEALVDQLIAVQPMQQPTAELMYMDIVGDSGPVIQTRPGHPPLDLDEDVNVNETAPDEHKAAALGSNRRPARWAKLIYGAQLEAPHTPSVSIGLALPSD